MSFRRRALTEFQNLARAARVKERKLVNRLFDGLYHVAALRDLLARQSLEHLIARSYGSGANADHFVAGFLIVANVR